ncbi:MAG TPA: tetratricopeptide repeat protein [Anaerolineae bacterium]
MSRGGFEQAIARCNELAAYYPDALRLIQMHAKASELSGDMTHAVDDYRRILDITPADARAMVGLARCHAILGNGVEARISAQQALALLPGDADAVRIAGDEEPSPIGRGQLALARSWHLGGLANRAFTAIRRMQDLVPDRSDVQVVLAEMLWRSGFNVTTIEHCQRILDAQPDCLNAHVILAILWKHIGNTELAVLHQAAIERLDPGYRSTRDWLGDASPFNVHDVPAHPQPPAPPEPEQETGHTNAVEHERLAWVDDLIAAASPVPPIASDNTALPAPQASENARGQLPAADVEPVSESERLRPIPLEWTPAHNDDDMPAWLTALRTQKPKPMPPEAETDAEEPQAFQRDAVAAAHVNEVTHNAEAVNGSPEDAPVVNASDAPAPDAAPAQTASHNGVQHDAEPTQPEADAAKSTQTLRKRPRRIRNGKIRPLAEDQLELAHQALAAGDCESAANHYAGLINASKKLDIVLTELDAATLRYPHFKRFYTLLGDAYKQMGEINAALLAYHRALGTNE